MNLYRNLETLKRRWLEILFLLKILIAVLTVIKMPHVNGVINGKVKDKGVYVIQSVAEPRYVSSSNQNTCISFK